MRYRVSRLNSSTEKRNRTQESDQEEREIFSQSNFKPIFPHLQTSLIQPKVLKKNLKEPISGTKGNTKKYRNSVNIAELQGFNISTESMRNFINLDYTPKKTGQIQKIAETGQNLSQDRMIERYERVIQRRKRYYQQFQQLHNRRNKTQAQQHTADSDQQSLLNKQKVTSRGNKIFRVQNLISVNYEHASMQDLWRTVPREIQDRNEENIRLFAYKCHKTNALLKKLQYVTIVELLKNCVVSIYEKNEIIYSREKRGTCSYIILWGEVAVIDQKTRMESLYEMGETLHENYLLDYRRYELKTLNQIAVSIKNTGLLQLTHKSLVLVKAELMEISLRSDLMNLQSQFRKSYLTKLSLRATLRQRHRRQSSFEK